MSLAFLSKFSEELSNPRPTVDLLGGPWYLVNGLDYTPLQVGCKSGKQVKDNLLTTYYITSLDTLPLDPKTLKNEAFKPPIYGL